MPPHALRANASSAIPSRFVFLDTETYPSEIRPGLIEHKLRLGVAKFWIRAGDKQPEREERITFEHAEQFWSWLERRVTPGKRVIVFAHNTQFDLQVLGGAQEISARGWQVTKAVIDSERVILRAQRDRASMLWLDWYQFLAGPLERSAELLGVPYVSLPPPNASYDEWLARCRNDVEILATAVRQWIAMIERDELGHFAPTLASQALHAFRHGRMEHELLLGSRFGPVALERAAYMGGRTEALTVGRLTEGPYYLVDVNSMYAAVMGRFDYPRRFKSSRRRVSKRELAELLGTDLVIARVKIATELPIFPAHHDERLVFPVGEFWTELTTPELREAIRRRAVLQVDELALYEPAPLFAWWVREIYALRLSYRERGMALEEELAKRMLQALYGKFGEKRREWVKIGDEPELGDELWSEYDADATRDRTYRRLGGVLAEREIEGEGYNAFPAIPAHVTAHGRMLLWQYIELAGRDHVHYVDTDSLIVDAHGRAQLAPYIDTSVIGRLREVAVADELTIEGPKIFTLGAHSRRKGIRADAELTESGKWRQSEWLGIGAQLRRGHSGGPLQVIRERSSERAVPPDRIGSDGRVRPLRLG